MRFGDIAADHIASWMGSWTFLILQSAFVALWMFLNTWHGFGHMWDSYPYILLNLLFSTQAAYAAPIIMMAQNRQSERDRHQADADYRTNVIASRNIDIHYALTQTMDEKLDQLIGLAVRPEIKKRKTVRGK